MLIAWLLVALEVHATGECPGAAEVERQLAPLLGAPTGDVATIGRAVDGAVSLTLADGAGQAIGERKLPRAKTCADQAKAVAVTLAVWEAELHPEISLGLERLAPEPAPPPREAPVVARAAPPPPSPAREVTLGVAALGDWQSGAWAPGARVELGLGRAGARWRARLAAGAVGRHDLALSPGTVSWWRGFVEVGADVDVARGRRWAVALGAGALAGVVSVAGAGYAFDRATHSADAGGQARARVEARLGRVRPWLGAALDVWVRRQALDIQGGAAGSALPHLAPIAALGAEFVW